MTDNKYQRFAWDGFSFDVPADWNLSDYGYRRDVSRIQMEDDAFLRLEMEWLRARQRLETARLQQRYAQMAAGLKAGEADQTVVDQLPPAWSAYLYSFPDGRHLLTAFRLVAGHPFFCFFKIHFPFASRREPERLIRNLARSFQLQEAAVISWTLYDIDFRLDREFRLVQTAFQAGRKMMVFEWRLRRLFIWFFSLADVVLQKGSLESWCADYLKTFKGLRGPVFNPGGPGKLVSRRHWLSPFGQIEEIIRRCSRYQARCLRLPAKNQIVLMVFQYRDESDLARLKLEIT